MLPEWGPIELSTAIDGEVLLRSLPSCWSAVKNSLPSSIGGLQWAPLSVERAKAIVLP
jgi:hypothetical protein